MDKAWIHSDRMSKEYEEGVECFIRGCLDNSQIDPNLIPCPCCKCNNMRKGSVKMVREHIFFNGFSQIYYNWIWHGEATMKDGESVGESVVHQELIKDGEKFETSNMCEAAGEYYTEDPEMFRKFVEEAEKPLYKGLRRYTKMSAFVIMYNTKASHGMTDALFTDLLMDFGDMLPNNHTLSSKNALMCLGLKHEKIHDCSSDCILYRKQYKDLVRCPKCNLSRWKLSKSNVEKIGFPAKVVWYFPPIPRFKRMFKSCETSKNLIWHSETTKVPGVLRHPCDSPSWKLVDHMWPEFGKEPRNLRLALVADGINPHSNLSTRHSC